MIVTLLNLVQIGHDLDRFLQSQNYHCFLLEENINDQGKTLTGLSIILIILSLAKSTIGIIFCIHISYKILVYRSFFMGEILVFCPRQTVFVSDYDVAVMHSLFVCLSVV